MGNKNRQIVLSNSLAASNFSAFSKKELVVLLKLIGDINPENKRIDTTRFTAKEFKERIGAEWNIGYAEMDTILSNIMKKPIKFDTPFNMRLLREESEYPGIIDEFDMILTELSCEDTANTTPIDELTNPRREVESAFITSITRIIDDTNPEYNGVKEIIFQISKQVQPHLLVARDAVKDEEGNIISGIVPYVPYREEHIDSIHTLYGLLLYLHLYRYSGVSIVMSFDDLADKLGITTRRAALKTEIKSLNSTGRKINKKDMKIYNFTSRKLPQIMKEISDAIGYDIPWNVVKKREDFYIKFEIPKRKKEVLDLNNSDTEDKDSDITDEGINEDVVAIEDSHTDNVIDESKISIYQLLYKVDRDYAISLLEKFNWDYVLVNEILKDATKN